MEVKQQINIAVVGVGYWGPNLVRNFYQTEGAVMHTVCDLNPARLEFIRKNYPAIALTRDFEEVLRNRDIDAVAIALPTKLHYEFCKKALEAGKHVLVEKPMASNVSEAEDLIRLAAEKQRVLMVDHTFVYYGPILKIKEIIDGGELGPLHYFDSQRINLGLIQPDVNVIWDLASHDIAILEFLMQGKPTAVSAVGTSHVGSQKEELAHLIVKHEEGHVAHVHVSWLSPVKLRQMLIGGTNKMIFFDDIQPSEKIKIYDKGVRVDFSKETPFEPIYRSGEARIPLYDSKEALLKECEDFVDCIKNRKSPLTSGEYGLKVIKILEACDQSLKEKGREVSLA